MRRLIYKSRSTELVDLELIADIVESSQQNNSDRSISGILLATRTHFMQVLEGEFDDVNEVFFRITSDPRNDQVQLISFSVADERIFGEWTMHGVGVFDMDDRRTDALLAKFGSEEGGLRFPITEWEALALISEFT
jgi:hypothetical protein